MRNVIVFFIVLSLFSSSKAHAQIPCALPIGDCYPERVTNGDFEAGNVGFGSALAPACSCMVASYCVATQALSGWPLPIGKCSAAGWQLHDNDHTTGNGNYLVVDGLANAIIWQQNIVMAPGPSRFSFWVLPSVSNPNPGGVGQNFQITINGIPIMNVTSTIANYPLGTNNWHYFEVCFNSVFAGPSVLAIRQVGQLMNGDYGLDDISLVQSLNANVTILPIAQPCTGDLVTLTANSALPVVWTDGNANVIAGNPITVVANGTQTYTATVDNFGCIDTATIIVNPLPGPTITNTEYTVCANGGPISFFQESLIQYFTDVYTVTGTTPLAQSALSLGLPFVTHRFNPAGLPPGDYFVDVCFNTLTNQCCTQITFHVLASPQLNIPDFTPCKNDPPFVMHVPFLPAGTTLTYSGNLSGVNTTTHTFNPGTATLGANTFTACYISNGVACCSTYTITVLSAPNVTTTLNMTVCETAPNVNIANVNGPLVNFSPYGSLFSPGVGIIAAITGTTFNFSTTSTGFTIPGTGVVSFNPGPTNIGTNTITYTVTSPNGCSDDAVGTINVCPVPAVTITAANPCTIPTVINSLVAPTPGLCPVTYSWTGPGITGTPSASLPNITANLPGTYTLTVTTAPGCSSSQSIVISNGPNVTSTLNMTVCETAPNINIAVVNGPLVNFPPGFGSLFSPGVGIVAALTGTTFNFSTTGTGFTIPGTGLVSFNPGPTNIGANTITYTVTSPTGCSDNAVGTINVCPIPAVTISATNPCSAPSILTALVPPTPSMCPVTYSWTGPGVTGATTSSVNALSPGTYTVTVTTLPGSAGCTTTASITLGTIPSITINISDPQPCVGETVNLSATSSGSYPTLVWTDNSSAVIGTGSSVSVSSTGTYCVTGTDINGCTTQACTTVVFNTLPSITIFGDTTICEDGDIALNFNFSGNCGSPSAQWLADGLPIPGATGPVLNIPNTTYPDGTVISLVYCCGGCCDTVDVAKIIKGPGVLFDPIADVDLCAWDGNPIQLSGSSNGTNCVYSGPGIVDANLGLFDPITAGGVGTYTLSLTCELNGCFTTVTQTVTVVETNHWHQTTFNAALRDAGNDVITDADGNVYITGFYTRQTVFNGGDNMDVPVVSFTSSAPFSFVAKYDDCGNLMWVAYAQTLAAGTPNYGTSITLDETNGYVYASGNFNLEINYNGGVGSFAGAPSNDMAFATGQLGYVARFSMLDGTIHYVDPIIIDDNTYANAITINENTGKIYVGGHRNGAMNPGQDFLYVQRYNPTGAGIGVNEWQIDAIGDGSSYVNDMDFDENITANGSLWFIGDFTIELLLGSVYKVNGSTTGQRDAYVARYDDVVAGSPSQFVFRQGTIAGAGEMTGNGIAVNGSNGDVYVTGYTFGIPVTTAFENPSQSIPNAGFQNAYFMSLDQSGVNTWAVPNYAEAGSNNIYGKAVCYKNGQAYFTGAYNGGSDFMGNSPLNNLSYTVAGASLGNLHTYAVAYDATNGNYIWTNATDDPLANNGINYGNSIAADNFGHAFITGSYMRRMGYQAGIPASGDLISSFATSMNAFTMRVDIANNGEFRNQKDEMVFENAIENNLKVYPNPTNGMITLELAIFDESKVYLVTTMSIEGKVLSQQKLNGIKSEIDLSGLTPGIYFISVFDGVSVSQIKVVKID